MKPKITGETAEQKQQRQRAEADNVRSIQGSLAGRTSLFQRIRSPRISIATGRSNVARTLVR